MYDLDSGSFVGKLKYTEEQYDVYRNKFYGEKYVAVGANSKVLVMDIQKQCQIKSIETNNIYSPYGFDVVSSVDRNIALLGGNNGRFCCIDLESNLLFYEGKLTMEARNIFGREDQKNLFCVGGQDEIQIHDLIKTKLIMTTPSHASLRGYPLGLIDSPVHSIVAGAYHYKKWVTLVDRKNMRVIGRSKPISGSIWYMEQIEDRLYVGDSGGGISVFDIKKYDVPLYTNNTILKRKISKILRIGDGNLMSISGSKHEAYIYESKTRFSEKKWKLKFTLDLEKEQLRDEPSSIATYSSNIHDIWGMDVNFGVVSKNLEMIKMDHDERVQYMIDEYLEEKKYSRRIKLDNTTISVFIFNLFQ